MAKVFLSHSSKDAALVDTIRAHLPPHEVFLDHDPVDGIAPGDDWERTLYDRLQWADVVVCLVTANHVESRWCFAEVALAKAQGRLVIPISAEPNILHPLLGSVQHVAYAVDPDDAIARVLDRLKAIDAGGGTAWDAHRAVFPGLLPFDVDDRAMFFGRDRETRELVTEVRARVAQRQPHALIVVGGSGSGKSSLVRAGLIPHLLDDASWWRLRPFVPGSAPMDALADALARARKELGAPPDVAGIRARLPGGIASIVSDILLEAPGDRRRLLVTIDQFEEVFTRAGDADRRAFIAALAEAAIEPDSALFIVTTVRSEFLGDLLRTPDATHLGERPFLLAPVGREQLEDIIVKPARKAQIALDPNVVRRLVDDTGSGEALPLLAFTLARLVEGMDRGARIDMARYEAIGGVRGSVQAQAESALSTVSTRSGCSETEVMDTLLGFVTLDDAGRPTRRRRRRADLDARAGSVVDAFVQARLLTADTENGVGFVGVAHETLFTAWTRMATAIAGAVGTLKLRRELERAASEWVAASRSPAFLWRDERLAQAQRLITMTPDVGPDERDFVDRSAAHALEIARRESTILADRVIASGLPEDDPELALLYLLAAADEYAVTTDVISGMRRALAAQRLVGRVGPIGARIFTATVTDDGTLLAVADAGTNPPVRPSTRAVPLPPVGAVHVGVWRRGEPQPRNTVDLPGRTVTALAWSRNGAFLAVAIDERVLVLDGSTLQSLASVEIGRQVTTVEFSRDDSVIEVGGREGAAFLARQGAGQWAHVDAVEPASTQPPRTPRDIPPPPRFTNLIRQPNADLLLNVSGRTVELWAAKPVDSPTDTTEGEANGVSWIDGPRAPTLATSPDGKLQCAGNPLVLRDLSANSERSLPWGFATAGAFSGDGRRLALASRVELAVFDVATLDVVARLGAHSDEEGDTYSSVALNADGSLLVSGSLGGGRSHVWEVASGARTRPIGARWVGVAPDGLLVVGARAGALFLDRPGEEQRELADTPAQRFGFAPDQHAMIAVQVSGDITEYSLVDGNVPEHYPSELDAIGFSADGRSIVGRLGARLVRWPDRSADAVIARARASVFRSLTDDERDRYELKRNPQVADRQ